MPKKSPDQLVVLGFQGNVAEHVDALQDAVDRLSLDAEVKSATDALSIREASAVSIPGGESTTISRLIARRGLKRDLIHLAGEGKPILGTCAGLILLAKEVNGQDVTNHPGFPAVMDISVQRNAFGRQRESFETELELRFPERTIRETGVFIRAPMIEETRGECQPISWVDGAIVAAAQGNIIGTCFHPELTRESRIYDHLLLRAGMGDEQAD